ncbi:potassium-transporting ATPase subunit KdpC [Cryobacterium sp. HLT2-28]|uniref:potassium-transporting ATPase subunit KdpC n=1 Tax=Cryobacterium sp. HLT2-28 TaxID=1259146 RepID=UPI00106B6579|nr:potassium-transporting ATPase subunit KdpC [Cryobacterium sp. HLT2-28]TFB97141.1 potassium-transporting ATPase subunit KdpC [Cryobacterium sp. HLT2-28]
MASPRTNTRHFGVALRAMLVLTVALGLAYPLVVTAIGQTAIPGQANGSLLRQGGHVVGSALIGQSFTDSTGAPHPGWFQPRPSAAGTGYDAAASGGSNQGPENPALVSEIVRQKRAIADFNAVAPDRIPADALTRSASGLDPDISPAYARLQVTRVAAARHVAVAEVRRLVESRIAARELGYLGEPTVNVLELNLALAGLKG